jgi:mannonate dehydratase
MKITEVRVIVTCPGRNYVLVKIMTDEPGIFGVGDGTLSGSELAVAADLEHLSQLIIGLDPANIEDIWQLIYHCTYWRGGPVFMSALSAIDLALWDIKGKVTNQPVYQLLGGRSREGVAVYTHAHGRDPQEVEEHVRSFLEKGFKYVRAQLTGGYGGYGGPGMVKRTPSGREGIPDTDYFSPEKYLIETPKMFEHLRSILGPEVNLLHDVHEQLTPNEASRLAKSLEPYRLFYMEDPLRPENKDSFKMVRRSSTTSIAMGELFTSRWDCIPLFMKQLIDFIRFAPIHIGGITEAKKIMVMAEPFQIRSAFHGAADIGPIGQAAAVNIDYAIPNFGVQEWITFAPETYEVMPGACQMEDGMVKLPQRPGLGIDINEELAAKYPYQRAYMPLIRRVDGTVHVY